MRIIAGTYRGKRLAAPDGQQARPTTGRMRERIFSMLQHGRYPPLLGAHVADLYAGTGALGLEAISRGASHATFVEKSSGSLVALKKNISSLQVTDRTKVLSSRATDIPTVQQPFNHIFMDPPYGKDLIRPTLDSLLEKGWIGEDTVIIAEMQKKETLDIPDPLTVIDDRAQGIQRIVFLGLA